MRTIRVEPGSEVAKLLDEAADEPVLLEKDGQLYRVSRESRFPIITRSEDIGKGYDPERAKAAIRKAAGSLNHVDADRLIQDIYRWREEGTRPPDRP